MISPAVTAPDSVNHKAMEHDSAKDSVTMPSLMAVYERMMADTVIRRRILADTAMRRMLLELVDQMPPEHREHLRAMLEAPARSTPPAHKHPPDGGRFSRF